MATIFTTGANNYGVSKWIVNSQAGLGTHTTLAGALAAAASGDTVMLMSSVTENVTINPGINIVGWAGPGVLTMPSITGKITMTAAGTCTIKGVQLITNGDYVIEITGTAASIIYLIDCYLFSTGTSNLIHSTTTNTSSGIWLLYCRGDFQAAGTGTSFIIAHGFVEFEHCSFYNTANSSTASTASNDSGAFFKSSYFSNVITTSGTSQSFTAHNCYFDLAFGGTLTIGGTGVNSIENSSVVSGTSAAISVSTTATLTAITNDINSSVGGGNAIIGAGTINYGGITFAGTATSVTTTTKNPIANTVLQGGTGLTATTANQILYSSAANTIAGLATGNNGTLITSGAGVPSISSTLPTAVQGNITSTGNLGNQTNTTKACFLATNVTADTNTWGDSSTNTVIFDTSIFDQNSNYSTSTGVFTAPVTGKYLFSSMVSLSNTGGTAVSNAQMSLVATARTLNGAATAYITTDPNGFITLVSTWIVDMTAADTAAVKITGTTTAGTKTGTIYGAAGASFTWFSGQLIC